MIVGGSGGGGERGGPAARAAQPLSGLSVARGPAALPPPAAASGGTFRLCRLMMRALALALQLAAAAALYADEAGVVDWHLKQIGVVDVALLRGEKAFVCSDRGIAGALDAQTGGILWRSELPEGERCGAVAFLEKQRAFVATSLDGSRARAHAAATGVLLWDVSLSADAPPVVLSQGSAPLPATLNAQVIASDDAVFVLGQNAVHAIAAASGEVLYSYFPEADESLFAGGRLTEESVFLHSMVAAGGGSLTVVASALEGRKPVALQLSLSADGLSSVSRSSDIPSAVARASAAGSAGLLLLPLGEGASLAVLPSAGRADAVGAAKSLSLSVPLDGAVERFEVLAGGAVLRVRSRGGADAVFSAAGGAPELVAACEAGARCALSVYSGGSSGAAFVAKSTAAATELLELRSGAWEPAAPLAAGAPVAARAFLRVRRAAGGAPEAALLLQSGAGDLSLWLSSAEAEVWKRDEGLAYVEDAVFVADRARLLSDAAAGVDPLDVRARLGLQRRAIASVLRSAADGTLFTGGAVGAGGATERDAHLFGFARTAVVLSALDRVYGIDMRSGAVRWAAQLPRRAEGSAGKYRLLRSVDAPRGDANAEVLLACAGCSGGAGAATALLYVDAESGQVSEAEPLPFAAAQAHLLGATDAASGRRAVAFVGAEADGFPTAVAPRGAAHGTLHFFTLGGAGGKLRSFRGALGAEEGGAAVQLGALNLPAEGESVAGVAFPAGGAVKTATHALGDGSLFIKYLNAHCAAVATVREGAEAEDGGETLFINVVDVVSGRLLFRAGHRHGAGPVRLSFHENWVVYAYWNARVKRTELGSITLYEGHIARKGLNPFNRPEREETLSSFTHEPPVALQRTFAFPRAVRDLAVSETHGGITPKAILVATEAGQVLSLDRRLLDPRRPKDKPKKSEKEEGLLQYSPFLPVFPTRVVNYDKAVAGLARVYAAPAKLESTTLVLAVGVDLFGTRTMPAKSFDLLAADFNKPLLLLVLAAFAAGTVAMRVLYRRKRLREAWA